MYNKIVYAWFADGLPFYIGIGKPSRAHSNKGRNQYCKRLKNKAKKNRTFEVRILHCNLSWQQACELEQSYIALYGRLNIGTGILTNMTDGGDGTIGRKHTEKTKKRLSETQKGRTGKHKRTSIPIVTPYGNFDSMGLAAIALKVDKRTISRRVKSNSSKFTGYKLASKR